jgi:hypothetical protein
MPSTLYYHQLCLSPTLSRHSGWDCCYVSGSRYIHTFIHTYIVLYILIICHGAGTTTQPIRPWAHPPRLASSRTRILRTKLASVRKLHGLSESCLLQCEHELRSWSSLHWCDGVGTCPSTHKWWRACLPSCTRRGPKLEQAHSEECGDACNSHHTQGSPESKRIPHTSWPITRALVNWTMCIILYIR